MGMLFFGIFVVLLLVFVLTIYRAMVYVYRAMSWMTGTKRHKDHRSGDHRRPAQAWRQDPRLMPQAAAVGPTVVGGVYCSRDDCRCENPPYADFCRRCGTSLAVSKRLGQSRRSARARASFPASPVQTVGYDAVPQPGGFVDTRPTKWSRRSKRRLPRPLALSIVDSIFSKHS